jgi:hypothetical protein
MTSTRRGRRSSSMTRHAAWGRYANALLACLVFTVLGPTSIAQAALGSSSATGDAALGATSQEAALQPAGDDDRDRCDRFDRKCDKDRDRCDRFDRKCDKDRDRCDRFDRKCCDRFDPWCDKDDRCFPWDPWCDKDDRCHPFDPWCDKDPDSTTRTIDLSRADARPVLVNQLL